MLSFDGPAFRAIRDVSVIALYCLIVSHYTRRHRKIVWCYVGH